MRRWKNVGWFLALLFAVLLRSAGACETRGSVYIDPVGGNDAQDCATEQTACKTAGKLQTLLNTAQPGAQILLKRGTTLPVPSALLLDKTSGTAEQPIVLGAYGEATLARPILDGRSMGGGSMVLDCRSQDYWTIQDLHLKGNKGAVQWQSCHHQILHRVDISTCAQECIHIKRATPETYAAFITIREVTITAPNRAEGIYIGTDPAQADGTYDVSQDVLIDRVTITGGAGNGGECIEMKQGSQRVTIQHSRFENNYVPQNGCLFSGRAAADAPAGNYVITNNVIRGITGAEGYGIRLRNDATIVDNDVSDTSQAGIYLEQLAGNPTYKRHVRVRGATP